MPSWVLKAAAQKLMSALPGAHTINGLLQARVTHTLDLTRERVSAQMGRCARHLEAYVAARGRLPRRILEVGTGWHPLLALGFHLCGCEEVRTVDRAALASRRRIHEALSAVAEGLQEGALGPVLPRLDPGRAELFLKRLPKLLAEPAAKALEALEIRYRVGREAEGPAPPADLVVTNSVLEHLGEGELRALLSRLRRGVAPDGVASHFVDLGDHYAVFDRRIGVYNFLKFSDGAWSLVNSRLHWQSRLRIRDYRRLLAETGWTIREEASRRGAPADLEGISLAPRFRSVPPLDLLVYRSWIRAVPVPGFPEKP